MSVMCGQGSATLRLSAWITTTYEVLRFRLELGP
jgi:hypothetical protein